MNGAMTNQTIRMTFFIDFWLIIWFYFSIFICCYSIRHRDIDWVIRLININECIQPKFCIFRTVKFERIWKFFFFFEWALTANQSMDNQSNSGTEKHSWWRKQVQAKKPIEILLQSKITVIACETATRNSWRKSYGSKMKNFPPSRTQTRDTGSWVGRAVQDFRPFRPRLVTGLSRLTTGLVLSRVCQQSSTWRWSEATIMELM